MDTVSGPGFSKGATAWLRYDPIWLGVRLGYSTYDPVDILTLTGELGFRFQGRVAELFFGFGLGARWLYGVSPERVKANDAGCFCTKREKAICCAFGFTPLAPRLWCYAFRVTPLE